MFDVDIHLTIMGVGEPLCDYDDHLPAGEIIVTDNPDASTCPECTALFHTFDDLVDKFGMFDCNPFAQPII